MIELSDNVTQMPPPEEVKPLMAELLAYCKAKRGRSAEMAKELGVKIQVLSNWLNLHKTPSLKAWFQLQAFAKKIRRRK